MPSDLNFSGFGKNASLIDAKGKVLDALGHAGKSVLAVQLVTLEISREQIGIASSLAQHISVQSPFCLRYLSAAFCLLYQTMYPPHTLCDLHRNRCAQLPGCGLDHPITIIACTHRLFTETSARTICDSWKLWRASVSPFDPLHVCDFLMFRPQFLSAIGFSGLVIGFPHCSSKPRVLSNIFFSQSSSLLTS